MTMTKGKALRLLIGLVSSLCIWSHGHATKRILVVHSYHDTFRWVQKIDKAIETVLKNEADITYQTFYMDTKRNPGEAWKHSAAQKAIILAKEYSPKVIIAVDDNAQDYFVKDYAKKSPVQFVFCGVNAEPGAYGYPAANVTGILERTYPGQTLRLLKTILPKMQRVAVIADHSTTTNVMWPRIKKRLSTLSPEISILQFSQLETFSEWKQKIRDLDQNAQVDALMISLYHTLRIDNAPISMDPNDVLRWTLAHTRKPVVGLWPFMVEGGGFLAATVDPREHGRAAAQMAVKILSGKTAADIPIQINQDGFVMINLKGKEHLAWDAGLDIDQIADLVIR